MGGAAKATIVHISVLKHNDIDVIFTKRGPDASPSRPDHLHAAGPTTGRPSPQRLWGSAGDLLSRLAHLLDVTDNSATPAQNETDPAPDTAPDTGTAQGLELLVDEWLTVPDAAERFGVPMARIRQHLTDRELLSARIGPRRVVSIPARFFDAEGPHAHLRGTFTVLGDGGMDDDEIIEWLFTVDPTLPVEGAPIDAMHAGFKTEVRRRAQELAF